MLKPYTAPREALSFAEGDHQMPKLQKLLRAGTFFSPKYGKIEITLSDLETMKKNFDARVRNNDAALDYGHKAGEEAAAWIKNLTVQDGALFAEFDWVPDGKLAVEQKKYKYLSADFTLDYEDNETQKKFGPVLFGAGLTNRPFLTGMQPVQLSDQENKMTLEEAIKKIEELTAENAKLKEGAAKAAQLPEAQAKAADMAKKFDEAHNELTQLREAAQKRDAEAAKSAKDKQFDDLLKAGKAVEAQREYFHSGDAIKFAEAFEPAGVKTERVSTEGEGAKTEGTAEEKIMKFADALVKDGKAPDHGQAISMVLRDEAHKEVVAEYNKQK